MVFLDGLCMIKGSSDAKVEPVKEKLSELYRWPEDKVEEFLRALLAVAATSDDEVKAVSSRVTFATTNTPSLVSAAKRSHVSSEEYYASRLKFLRSYQFTTRKESVKRRAIKWLKNKVHALVC